MEGFVTRKEFDQWVRALENTSAQVRELARFVLKLKEQIECHSHPVPLQVRDTRPL